VIEALLYLLSIAEASRKGTTHASPLSKLQLGGSDVFCSGCKLHRKYLTWAHGGARKYRNYTINEASMATCKTILQDEYSMG
jgi:hypothetical protein